MKRNGPNSSPTKFSRLRLSRRLFLGGLAASGGLALAGQSFLRARGRGIPPGPRFPGELLGPSMAAGHRLREASAGFPEPSEVESVDVAIVGGGIAGLSAAWRVQKSGQASFVLLELEEDAGGNARGGARSGLAYPWGAHYVPALTEESAEAIELLQDLGAIAGRDPSGALIYDEFMLCHAPHERLFIGGRWQDGLLPQAGVDPGERAQMRDFLDSMARWSARRGSDGRPAFAIPVERSSRDPEAMALDRMTMRQHMAAQGWTSPHLNWYVDYCCRDDFGTPIDRISAWAGVHYFAARTGRASGEARGQVLTWPEGNAWIARGIARRISQSLRPGQLAFDVAQDASGVEVRSWNPKSGRVRLTRARTAILACPRFVATRLLRPLGLRPPPALAVDLSYAPWMVANVHVRRLPGADQVSGAERVPGAPLSWDNVFYGNRSLGYVVATHQLAQIHVGASVLTYYLPLDRLEPKAAREEASRTSLREWQERVVADLDVAHPGIAAEILRIDAWVWGHAMARPTPGFIWGDSRRAMAEPFGRAHFAHSDMGGISVFEEACFQGVRAANAALMHAT